MIPITLACRKPNRNSRQKLSARFCCQFVLGFFCAEGGGKERKILVEWTQDAPHGGGARSYYVIGEARTNADNAITKLYGSFFMAFEVSEDAEEVLDFGCTHTLELTEKFLRRIFVGKHFPSIDNWLEAELETRYGGSSRRAILTAYRDALKRYCAMRKGGR